MAVNDLKKIAQEEHQRKAEFTYQILVCKGTGCIAAGAEQVYEKFIALSAELSGVSSIELTDQCAQKGEVKKTGCHGFCQAGPLVTIQLLDTKDEMFYCHVKPEDVAEIVETSLKNKKVVERLLYHDSQTGASCQTAKEIPFYAKQKRFVLADCGHIDPESIKEYIQGGGYTAARNVILQSTPEQVCSEVLLSGLRGRGGAGYLAGKKWFATLNAEGDRKYLVCNGDEGDPGAFMDRSLLEGSPHRVLEGVIIAAYATGASYGYFYIRAEYPLALERIQKAIDAAREIGILGKNIFDSDFSFDCEIVEGAGAFVCGESTAMIRSIEGFRGMPEPLPRPRTTEKGLWGQPTLLNNVKTFAYIPEIITRGGGWFSNIGTKSSSGTAVFALSGQIRNSGLIEVPMGITLREIIFDIGGGIPNGKKFKAAQIGGPSGGCLNKEHLDISIDFDSLAQVGAMMGSGGIVILDESTCMVEISRFFMQFTQDESCGKCALCREGTRQMLGILQDITDGSSRPGDIELLEKTAKAVKTASLCGLGKSAPNPVLSTLALFKSEYLAHTERLYCPAGVCSALKTFTIDPTLCKGCTLCIRECPVSAIQGEKRKPHYIDSSKCTKCGVCASFCRFAAISVA